MPNISRTQKIEEMAEALWGFGYQSALKRHYGYNIRTVQRWFYNHIVPSYVENDLRELLQAKQQHLSELIK